MTVSRKTCLACGDSRWQAQETIDFDYQHTLYAADDAPLRAALTAAVRQHTAGYQMQRCGQCGLEAAHPLVNPGSDWYGLAYGALSLYPTHRWEFDRSISILNASHRIADFGCGSGKFLMACRSAGLTAAGFDFSPEAIASCHQQGLQAQVLESVGSDRLPGSDVAPYSHITSFHVLEQLDDPVWFFKLAAASTTPNGEILLSVPSDRRMSRVYGETDFLDQPPHHLTRWTRAALQAIGNQTGWALQSFEYEPWPLSNELWARAIRQPSYKQRVDTQTPPWQERLLRLAHYPGAAMKTWHAPHRLSGFSMFARFNKG